MLKKSVSIILCVMMILMLFPVGVLAGEGDVQQTIPVYNAMEELSGITSAYPINKQLTQDKQQGKYAAIISVGDITDQDWVSYTLIDPAKATVFDISTYSQIKVWIKPGVGAKWVKFFTNNTVQLLNDQDNDGLFEVGQDFISGKWNLITLDLNRTASSISTEGKGLSAISNDRSTWSFDEITSVYSPVTTIDPSQMVNDSTRWNDGQLQFIPNGASTFNTTPTTLVSPDFLQFKRTDASQSDFSAGNLTRVLATVDGNLELAKNNETLSVSGGSFHSLALKENKTVWAWGRNDFGQLGSGNTSGSTVPVQVYSMSDVKAVTAGYYHSMALKSDGTVWTWGNNSYGQLGDGTVTNKNVPIQVSGLNDVVAIAAGMYYSMALKSDGTVWTWGYNNYGQLGNGTTTSSSVPIQVSSLTGVKAIAAGYYHALVGLSDGTVKTWGRNTYGQLGDGTTTNSLVPVSVSTLTNVSAIAGGIYHSVALQSDGSVWTWGYNNYGQLGNGTYTNSSLPVQVSNIEGMVAVSSGKYHSLSIKSDGTVWTWGYNSDGQIGDNTLTNRTVPILVPNNTNIAGISGGDAFSLALKKDGTVLAWGDNVYGQLGDSSTTDRKVPVQAVIKYHLDGFREVTVYLSSVGVAANSQIAWNDIVPDKTNLIVETSLSLDKGLTWSVWKPVPNGEAVHGITSGTDLSNAVLKIRTGLLSSDINVTPKLKDITLIIDRIDYNDSSVLINGKLSRIYIDSSYSNSSQAESALQSQRLYLDGIKPTKLSLSGDGTKAYYANPSDGNKLYCLNLYTGEAKKVSDLVPTDIKVNYDGSKVAFTKTTSLYQYDDSNGSSTLISNYVKYFTVTSDGSICYYYSYSTTTFNIYLYQPGDTVPGTIILPSTSSLISGLYISRNGSKIFYTIGTTLYLLENTPNGWKSSSLKTMSSNISTIVSNSDGSMVFLNLSDGTYYSYELSSKALRTLDLTGTLVPKVTDNNKLFVRDSNYKFLMYDPNTDASISVRPSDAANNYFFDIDDSGNKMLYVSGSGISNYYINGVNRPEKYLFSFDGKNSWYGYRDGSWSLVKAGGTPEKTDFDNCGMTVTEVNKLTDEDFDSLYVDGKQFYHFDLAIYYASTDAFITPSLKSIKVTLQGGEVGLGGQVLEQSLYTSKQQSFDSTNWRKIRRIYPIEIQPKEAEMYYLIVKDGVYKSYKNNRWIDVNSTIFTNIEGNWIDSSASAQGITQVGMTAAELRAIPEFELNKLLPATNITVAYAMKVNDISTEGYSSLITVDYVEDLFVSANLVLKITMTDGKVREFAGLTDTQVEDFMQWLNERQYSRGPVFYTIKTPGTAPGVTWVNGYVNYYLIQYVDVDEMS